MGQIQSLDPNGAINVRWPSGEITRCYPQELYIVGDEVKHSSLHVNDKNDSLKEVHWLHAYSIHSQ